MPPTPRHLLRACLLRLRGKKDHGIDAPPAPRKPSPWPVFSTSLLVSLGFHFLLLLAVGGFIIHHTQSGPRLFVEALVPNALPLVEDMAPPPPLADAPSPTGIGDDDDPGASPDTSSGAQNFQQGFALDLVANPGTSSFQLPIRNPGTGSGIPGGGLGQGSSGSGTGRGRSGSGTIMGLNIASQRLGVLLDVSGSMHTILPEVLRQIDEQFGDYVLVLIPGCSVEARTSEGEFSRMDFETGAGLYLSKSLQAQFQALPFTPFVGPYADGGQAIEYIIGRLSVDSIYWFSDFQDRVTSERMAKLGQLLEERRIKLYVHSVEARPHPVILHAVQQSGGSSQVKKLK
jgi:hypothetical protein